MIVTVASNGIGKYPRAALSSQIVMTRGSTRVPARSPKELINNVGSSVVYEVIVQEHASIALTNTEEVE